MRCTARGSSVRTGLSRCCLNIDDITGSWPPPRPGGSGEVWEGWHAIAPPIRADYSRFVELANKGARELGFADTGAMWRAKYDMPADAFTGELERLWDQVQPLYVPLHAYVRMKLNEQYGDAVPAVRPDSGSPPGEHLGAGLVEHLRARGARRFRSRLSTDRDPQAPEHRADRHGSSRRALLHVLGVRAAPPTFWERSLFVRAAGSRSRLSRQRLGHRPRGRRAHQDVHRADGRRLHDHSPRARPQFLSARVQASAGPFPRAARTTDSTKPSATP